MRRCIAIFVSICSLSACSLWQIPIEQGNALTSKQIKMLRQGQTYDMVIAQLGSPVLTNVLDNNRLDYVYFYQHKNQPNIKKRLILHFKQGKLVKIED